MLLTETQFARLDVTYQGEIHHGPAGPQVDAAILTVDPKRCAHEWQPSKGDPRTATLDAIARDVAARLRDTDITTLIPRISNISLGLDDGVLSAATLVTRLDDASIQPRRPCT